MSEDQLVLGATAPSSSVQFRTAQEQEAGRARLAEIAHERAAVAHIDPEVDPTPARMTIPLSEVIRAAGDAEAARQVEEQAAEAKAREVELAAAAEAERQRLAAEAAEAARAEQERLAVEAAAARAAADAEVEAAKRSRRRAEPAPAAGEDELSKLVS